MEPANVGICKLCMKCVIDPRILPCSDSFCLKCLESSAFSKKSPKCPKCKIEFIIPQGGLKDLKKNEFIEQLGNVKQKYVTCDSCKKNQAINFCFDCSLNYCSTYYFEHPDRIPIASCHRLEPPTLTKDKIKNNNYSTCKEHSEMETLFCRNCKVLLCGHCFILKHRSHEIEHISEWLKYIKDNLELNLDIKGEILENVLSNLTSSKDKLYNNEFKASNVKKNIQQRGEYLKKIVDSIVVDLMKNVDEELKQHQKEADGIMEELRILEMNLKAEIETLKEQLNNVNYENEPEALPQTMDICKNFPIYSEDFNISFYFYAEEDLENFQKIFGNVGKAANVMLVERDSLDGNIQSFALYKDVTFFYGTNDFTDKDNSLHSKLISQVRNGKIVQNTWFDEWFFEVDDLLAIDDMLFVSGIYEDLSYYILKFLIDIENSEPLQIFKHPPLREGSLVRMSKSMGVNILVALANEILILSTDGGVLKVINLSFEIFDALHFDKTSYVVCSLGEICVIDDHGHKLVTRSSLPERHAIGKVCRLTKDNHECIYACDIVTGKLYVFDRHLNLKSSLDVEKHLRKICYDEEKDVLRALTNSSALLTFEL